MYKGGRAQVWWIPPNPTSPHLPKSQEILQLQNMNILEDWFLFGHYVDKKNAFLFFYANSLI